MAITKKLKPKRLSRFRIARQWNRELEHVFDAESTTPTVSRCGMVDWVWTDQDRIVNDGGAHKNSAINLMIMVPAAGMCSRCRASVCQEIWRKGK